MVISAIRILRTKESRNRLRGVASVTIDNMLVIHDIKIIENQEGLFMGMPSKDVKGKEFKDVAHPISKEAREIFEKLIVAGYKEAVALGVRRLDYVLREDVENIGFLDLSNEHYECIVPFDEIVAV